MEDGRRIHWVFRWCVEGAVAEARKDWDSGAQGLSVDERLLRVLAWADDLFFFADSRTHLESMMASIQKPTLQRIGHNL